MEAHTYDISINVHSEKCVASPTLAKLFLQISKNRLSHTSFPRVLIGNMVTKFVRKKYTPLLIDLTVLIKKKETVAHACDCGVACSYDELKRFRSSVACDACERMPPTDGLV